MNKNLRLKIEDSIRTRQMSENIFFLCLAHLNESIEYSPLIVKRYIHQRDAIAKAALSQGVGKKEIAERIRTISKKDYPTFNQIAAVADIVESNDYTFINGYIPTKGHIHFKTDAELEADSLRKPARKKVDAGSEELQEIMEHMKKEYGFDSSMDGLISEQIQKAKTESLTYALIMHIFIWYSADIKKSIAHKVSKEGPFNDSFAKLSYIIGIMKRKKNDALERARHKEKEEEDFWIDNAKTILDGDETLESMIYIQCEKYPDAEYYGKHEYVKECLEKAMEKVMHQI